MIEARNKDLEDLFQAFACLDNPDDVRVFLEDLFTIQELRDISQRLAIARMLTEGQSYVEIEAITGASATTIARVSRCLGKGPGGYRLAMGVLEKDR